MFSGMVTSVAAPFLGRALNLYRGQRTLADVSIGNRIQILTFLTDVTASCTTTINHTLRSGYG
mgnify:CR=1 FL=1